MLKRHLLSFFLLLLVISISSQNTLYPAVEEGKYLSLIDITGKRIKGPFKLDTKYCVYNDCGQSFGHPDLRQLNYYLKIRNGTKEGLINRNGDVILKPVYDSITYFLNFMKFRAVVTKDGKQGVLDSNDVWIVPPVHEQLTVVYPVRNKKLGLRYGCKKTTGWGLIDGSGKEILPFIFDEEPANYGEGDLWTVKYNGKTGILDGQGKIICDTIYESIEFKSDHTSYGLVKTADGAYGYLNALGKLMIPPSAGNSPYTFKNGMFERSLEQDRKILIDTNGKQVLPGFYNEFEETPSKAILLRKGKKSGLIDSSGKIIIPCVYDDIKFLDIPGVPAVYNLIIVKQLNFYGAYNFQGKQIVPVKYQSVSEDYHTGKIAVKLLGKWGVIDSTGAMIVKPVYEEIGLLTRANYKFKSLGKWGLGNYADPKLNVSPQYSEIDWSWDDSHYFTVRKGGKAGLISADGKIILNAEYGYIEPRPDSYFWRYRDRIDPTFASKLPKDFYYVTKDEKKGIYSISRQWVVPLEYDKIDRYNNGVAEALKGKKKILLDASGKEFIPGGLDNNASYTKYVDDIIVVTINKKSGLYRKNGELILPAEYDSIGDYKLSYDDHGFALFYKDNKVGVLDYKGKIAVALSNHTFLNNFRDGAGIISENGYVWAYIDPKGELIWKEEKKSGNFYRAIPQVCLYDKMESLTFGNAEQSFDEYFTFPPCLFTLGNLKRLSILNKQIDSLPATIGKLSRLNYFQLSSNKALHFPEEFSALKNIDTLVVTANNPLPEKVNQLPALKYLSFNSPSSADLPLLPQLKHLVYYGDTLPAVTSKFENLETLEFRNTQLYSNSESNAATAKRELKECDAGRMPSCIFNLKNLKRLIIDHTKVDSIPPAIGNLSQLNYLFIKLSPINRFPSSLMNLKNLDTLIIDTYTSLDSGLTFPNVKYFSCRQGVLPVLPSAKYIKCEKVELPASLVKSTSLETLDVSVDNTMGGYYEGQTDLALDLKNFFATLEKIPTLRTLAISTKADTGGGIVSELIRNKEGLDKCKSIRKVVVENYQFIVGDKERFESAFPGITLERK